MTPLEEKIEIEFPMYHDECDDSWYSCPKSEGGCSNEAAGEECTCGVEQRQQRIKDFCKSIIEEEHQRIMEASLTVPPAKSRDWIDGFHSCLTQVRNIISKPNI